MTREEEHSPEEMRTHIYIPVLWYFCHTYNKVGGSLVSNKYLPVSRHGNSPDGHSVVICFRGNAEGALYI